MIDEKKMEMLEARFLKNPKSILFARLADYYLHQNRVDEAVNLCKEGIKYHPYYITGNFILGKAYIAANEYDKAEEALKEVLSHDRQHLAAHELLAQLMTKLGWENKAAVHYKEILKIDPLNNEVRQALNNLAGNEIEHEEPPPIVADVEEDLPSSNPETSSSDDKPWMKKLEEAFPKHFAEASPETMSAPDEETTMESLISQTETLIEKNIKPQKSSESSDGIHEVETEDLSDTDQTGQAIQQEEMDEPFFEEKELSAVGEEEESHKTPPPDETKETVEEDLFKEVKTFPDEQTIQDEKEVTEEEVLFEALTPESDQDVAQDEQKSEEENLFGNGSREHEREQIVNMKEEDEVFFEPMTLDSELTIAQIEQKEKLKEKDLSTPPSSKSAEKKSQEKKEEPEKEELFLESDFPEIEEASEKKNKKTEKTVPDKKIEKSKKEIAITQKNKISEHETKTEEGGFIFEVTEPEVSVKDNIPKLEPPESDQSKPDEKKTKERPEEKTTPPPIEEKPEQKTPEPEPEIQTEESELPKPESPSEDKTDKKKTKIMTPTLGEIYAAQGQFEKAIKVYENLLEKSPGNKQYQEKIEELKNKLKDTK